MSTIIIVIIIMSSVLNAMCSQQRGKAKPGRPEAGAGGVAKTGSSMLRHLPITIP